jgi:hypothetical protein
VPVGEEEEEEEEEEEVYFTLLRKVINPKMAHN